jgi:formylglycine-generating enzyme required for sulfatase activity
LRGVPNHPVRYVDWYDALAYCKWLNEKLKELSPISEEQNDFLRKIRAGKLIVTLPSEAEWEKAARHSPLPSYVDGMGERRAEPVEAGRGSPAVPWRGEGGEREFPWGNDFIPENANINNILGTTSAVGCFSNGRSPYNVEDMAGNVWEWTCSAYKNYPFNAQAKLDTKNDKGIRVLRGGAFDLNVRYARCAYRDWDNPPGVWYKSNGFRVVAASPLF